MDQVLNDDFMTMGYMPSRLPLSCLTMPPRFDARMNNSIISARRPLGEVNREPTPLITNEILQGIIEKRYRKYWMKFYYLMIAYFTPFIWLYFQLIANRSGWIINLELLLLFLKFSDAVSS